MLTRADVRAAALALPEAYASSHFDVADFRVNKKIFATLHEEAQRMVLKLDPEDQHNLADGDVIQKIPNSWGAKGWTYVYFEKLEPERLPELLRMAWAQVAPKRLLK
jgi:hypothetical protein